jgi:lipopolysaccharide/colanic/teichoic acid biosynthesis glycosyltransferase
MAFDKNNGVTHNQSRISNNDRSQMTGYNNLDNGQADDLKRYEAMNRRNWIAVISFIGLVVAIVLLVIILSLI